MFIRNRWYVAAWDKEVGRKPLARTICGEQVVLYRRADATAVALHDACPHRLLPLSMGAVEGDGIRCSYHGLLVGDDGRCLEMPGHEPGAQKLSARAYPVVERYRFVWVWIGEPALADPAKVPDLWFCEDPAWTFDGDRYHVACDYRLLVDNLMDLSHETFVHPSSIGQKEIVESPIETRLEGEQVVVERWMRGIDAPPFWRTFLKRPDPVDRWQICHFSLPANVMIEVGVAVAGTGAPEGDRSQGVQGVVVNCMTPETEDACWYYWGMARAFDIGDLGLSERMKASQAQVFAEDTVVLEAQQESIRRNPGARLITLGIDAGGAHARRLIEAAVQASR
ncbi:aromatic ring-hydroxylating dioxygenase subunit alpha [Phenylobacterium soli]|uniref:Aromatic ring-hydroxylating dioxygenase subunit alpha n=1 Tax=Phenylobacterium soli TaxID=2170551 RepID=A0A328AB31_9CAUL|nr:aromatic ring-hydroxylating dioxygenase subunit alpha [Phenylobacterium soli]RAK51785.1 aromatic ring-hydroxylating dioxygenase subunit alpha [Phenylobacterium soli]